MLPMSLSHLRRRLGAPVSLLMAVATTISLTTFGCGGNSSSSTAPGTNPEGGRSIRFGVARGSDDFTGAVIHNPGVRGQGTFEIDVPEGAKSLLVGTANNEATLPGASVTLIAPATRGPETRIVLSNDTADVEGGTPLSGDLPEDPQQFEQLLAGKYNLKAGEPPAGAAGSRETPPDAEAAPPPADGASPCTDGKDDTPCSEAAKLSSGVLHPAPGKWKVVVDSSATDRPFTVNIAVIGKNGTPPWEQVEAAGQQAYAQAGLPSPTTRAICSGWRAWIVRAAIRTACRIAAGRACSALVAALAASGIGIPAAIGAGAVCYIAGRYGCNYLADWLCDRI